MPSSHSCGTYVRPCPGCADGYMNIALEQTEEYVHGQVSTCQCSFRKPIQPVAATSLTWLLHHYTCGWLLDT